MNASFKPLHGLSQWLIFWLKVYVVVNLISIPDTLWTHYSFTRSLATLEISEQEIAEMLERMSDDEFSPPALDDQQQDDLLLTEQTFEADDSSQEVSRQPAKSTNPLDISELVKDEEDVTPLSATTPGDSPEGKDFQQSQIQPTVTESAMQEEGPASDLAFDSPEFDLEEFAVNDFELSFTVWDWAQLLFGFALMAGFLVSYTLSGIVFLKWVYRANRNLGLFADTKPQNSPSWAAWSFFVPIANIFIPPKIMQELYSIASKGAHSSLVGLWWTLAIIDYLVTKAGFRMMQRSRNNPIAFLASNESLVIDLLNAGMAAALGFATLRLVQQISTAYAANIRESTEAPAQRLAELI